MDKFILKHQYIDERTDEIVVSNEVEFMSDSLFTDFCSGGSVGILTRLEEFLRGSGFNVEHLIIEEGADEESRE